MTFAAYLQENEIEPEAAAKALGKTRAYIHMLMAGTCTPSLQLSAVIEVWTDGHVPMQTWPDWKEIRKQVKPFKKKATA